MSEHRKWYGNKFHNYVYDDGIIVGDGIREHNATVEALEAARAEHDQDVDRMERAAIALEHETHALNDLRATHAAIVGLAREQVAAAQAYDAAIGRHAGNAEEHIKWPDGSTTVQSDDLDSLYADWMITTEALAAALASERV